MGYLEAVDALAQEFRIKHVKAEELIRLWRRWGLCNIDEDDATIYLSPTAQQFVDQPEQFDNNVLEFLPFYVDDLWGRRSLLFGGLTLIDAFREDLVKNKEPEEMVWILNMLPDAFHPCLDRRLAVDLLAAASSLMTNLSRGLPAASLAEEICAVELISQAESFLELLEEEERIDRAQRLKAKPEFNGLFELFEDDDVLALWDIPTIPGQQGQLRRMADDWFRPFGGVIATGYLSKTLAARS
jgi:hypothetical protein